jgi:hypothetical protein
MLKAMLEHPQISQKQAELIALHHIAHLGAHHLHVKDHAKTDKTTGGANLYIETY